MSRFDIDFQMRRWLKRRIQQLVSIPNVECEVLEVMADDMGIDHNTNDGVHEYYREVSVMTDEEFRKRLLQAVQKIKKKKEITGVA